MEHRGTKEDILNYVINGGLDVHPILQKLKQYHYPTPEDEMISFLTEVKSQLTNDCAFKEKVSKLIVYQIVKKYFEKPQVDPACRHESDYIELLLQKIREMNKHCTCGNKDPLENALPTLNYPTTKDFVLTVHHNENERTKESGIPEYIHPQSVDEPETTTLKRIDYEFYYKQPTISSFETTIHPISDAETEETHPRKRFNSGSTEENNSSSMSLETSEASEAHPKSNQNSRKFAQKESTESTDSKEMSTEDYSQNQNTENTPPSQKAKSEEDDGKPSVYDKYSTEFIKEYISSAEVKEMNSNEFSSALHYLKKPTMKDNSVGAPPNNFHRRFSLFKNIKYPVKQTLTTTTEASPSVTASPLEHIETTTDLFPKFENNKYPEYVDPDLFEELIKSTEEIPSIITTINPATVTANLRPEHPNLNPIINSASQDYSVPHEEHLPTKLIPHSPAPSTTTESSKNPSHSENSLEFTEDVPTTITITTPPPNEFLYGNGLSHTKKPLGVIYQMTTIAPTSPAYLHPENVSNETTEGLIHPTGINRKNNDNSLNSSDQTESNSNLSQLDSLEEKSEELPKVNQASIGLIKELPNVSMENKHPSVPNFQSSAETETSTSNKYPVHPTMYYEHSSVIRKQNSVASQESSEFSLELSREISAENFHKHPQLQPTEIENSKVQPSAEETENKVQFPKPNKILTTTTTEYAKRKETTVPVPIVPQYEYTTVDYENSPKANNGGSRRNNDGESESSEPLSSSENVDNMIMELPKPIDNKDYAKYIRVKHMLSNKAPLLKIKGTKANKKKNLLLTLNEFLKEGVDSDTNDAIRYYINILQNMPTSEFVSKDDHTNFQKILPRPENEREETYFSNLTNYLQQMDPIIKQVGFPADQQDKEERLAQLLQFLRQTNKAKKYKQAIDYYLQNKIGKKKLSEFSYLSLMQYLPKPEDEIGEHHYNVMKNFLQDDNVMLLMEFLNPAAFENKLELFKVLSTEVLNSNFPDEIKKAFTYYFGEPKLIRIQLLTHKEIRKKFDITEILIDTLIVDDVPKQQAFTTFFDFISQSKGDLLQNFEGWINVKTEGEFITALLKYLLEQDSVPDPVKSAINKLIPVVRMDGDGAKPI